jgi:acyl-CoA synthetase (AMP-forming)/AMP-acid ligase II
MPRAVNLITHIRGQVAAYGRCRAVTFLPDRADPVRVTFAELDRQARATAAWLTAQGLAGQPAVLLYPAGPQFLAAFLGCLYARVLAIPAPLPQARPRHLSRLQALIRDAQAQLILTDDASHRQLSAAQAGIPVRTPDPGTDPSAWTPPALSPGTVAYLQYTSGSTTQPRGVQVTHGSLLHNLRAIRALAPQPARVLAGWLPHYHDMGLVGLHLHALYSGADLVLTAPERFTARPVRWLEMITRYRADWTVATDFGYAWCARQVTDAQLAGLDLSCLRMAITGAEPVKAATLNAFGRRFARAGFSASTWAPCYGMAEATLMITGTRSGAGPAVRRFDATALEHGRADPAAAGVPLVASGRPVDLDVRITDPRTGSRLPDRRIGEIWAAGPSIAAGYHSRPDATRQCFPVGARPYLRTGDLGFTLDGDLYVTGRLKEIIILHGRNLHPHDLEEAARQACPAAGPGAAFAITAPDGREHAALVQELRPGHPPARQAASTIINALGREFSITISLILVGPGQVRRTTSGKIRRHHMRDLLLAGQLSPLHQELEPAITPLLPPACPVPAPRSATTQQPTRHAR